jgi:hypothetical protein
MKIRIATRNLNTRVKRKNGILNDAHWKQKVTFKKGGIRALRSSLKINDHAPLLAEITI